MSLNIPAVKVLEAVGAGRLYSRLQQAGVDPVLPKGADPSLAMALGGVGLRLADLAQLYAAIARGGEPVVAQAQPRRRRAARARRAASACCRQVAAWYVARHPVPRPAAGQRQARPGLLQDRHLLRLPRCLVGRLRRPPHHRRVGGPRPTAPPCRA